jgi:DNA-directed RNA polymerase specialized sigma54-like protein
MEDGHQLAHAWSRLGPLDRALVDRLLAQTKPIPLFDHDGYLRRRLTTIAERCGQRQAMTIVVETAANAITKIESVRPASLGACFANEAAKLRLPARYFDDPWARWVIDLPK